MRRASPLLCFVLALAGALGLAADVAANGITPATYTFQVLWDGKAVVGVTRVAGLVRRTEVLAPRNGGSPNGVMKAPGTTTHEPIVIERRLGFDKTFEQWANKVWKYGAGLGSEMSLGDYRKDVRIDLLDGQGKLAMSYRVYGCWPSEYVVLGDLESAEPVVPIEVLVLQYDGWERDHSVVPAP